MNEHASWSQLWLANTCQYRWNLEKVRGIKPLKRYRAPTMGSAVHVGIEAAIRGNDPNDAIGAWAKEQVNTMDTYMEDVKFASEFSVQIEEGNIELDLIRHEAPMIVERAVDYICLDEWVTVDGPDGEPLIESWLQTGPDEPVIPGWDFAGVVDWVAMHKESGLIWLIDWKCKGTFQPVEAEETNLQAAAYTHLLYTTMGLKIDGSRILQIRPDAPRIPKINKNGSISKSDCKTTWEVYRDTCIEYGQNPDDYLSMKEKLDAKEWFRWSKAFRTEEEVTATWFNVVVPRVAQLANIKAGKMEPARSLGSMECHRCWAKTLCLEELRGRPAEETAKLGFYQLITEEDDANV